MNLVTWFTDLPYELATVLIAMLPIAELRVSIPVALEIYHLPIWKAILFSVIGDMLPTFLILYFLPKLHGWIIKHKFLGVVLTKYLKRAEQKFAESPHKWGIELALVVFIGIPLPMTGAWTGALIAFILNLPLKKSLPLIFAGVCMAATIVTLITLGASGVFRFLF